MPSGVEALIAEPKVDVPKSESNDRWPLASRQLGAEPGLWSRARPVVGQMLKKVRENTPGIDSVSPAPLTCTPV